MEDGTPPPFGTLIERSCGTTVAKEAAVGADGYYSFQIGGGNRFSRIFPDASERLDQDSLDRDMVGINSMGSMNTYSVRSIPLSFSLLGCEFRAQLAGYRSTTVRFVGGQRTGLIEAGTIVLYPTARLRGTVVSVTNLLAPKAAQKALSRAVKAYRKRKFDDTEKLLKSAVEIYPKYAEAWLDLGQLYQVQQRNEEARSAYMKAKDIDKTYVGPYIGLAQLSTREKKWGEVAEYTDQTLSLDPISFPEGYFLNSLAYYHLDNLDLAEKSARKGLRLGMDKQTPRIHLIIANILARRNDRVGSIEAMRKYLKIAPNATDAEKLRALVQESEKMAKASAENAKP